MLYGFQRLSPVKYLETVRVVGRFFRNDDSDWGVQSRAQGICGRIRAVRITQRDAKGGFQGALGALRNHVVAGINPLQGENRALMAGVLLPIGVALNNGEQTTLLLRRDYRIRLPFRGAILLLWALV